MEIKALDEVDLRAATAPLNRNATSFLPLVRTPVQLRERARLGVLDLKLSRAAVLGEQPGGACLLERDGDEGFIAGVGAEQLAAQRGGGWQALLDAVLDAAGKAGVRRVTVEASEHDPQQLGALQAAGFVRSRELSRYTLAGAPNHALVPPELDEAGQAPASGSYARAVSIDEALPLLRSESPPFGRRVEVLRKLEPLYTLRGLFRAGEGQGQGEDARPHAVVVVERERKLLVALGGEPEAAAQLAALAAARHEARFVDAVPEGDPLAGALVQAGFQLAQARVELARTL